jgi:hypothetical protein
MGSGFVATSNLVVYALYFSIGDVDRLHFSREKSASFTVAAACMPCRFLILTLRIKALPLYATKPLQLPE